MRIIPLAAMAALLVSPVLAQSMIAPPAPPGIEVPDWALPQSPTHKQVPPPQDFHRAPVNFPGAIGQFEGQTDVGGALAPGSASYDGPSKTYTISSAGYNIWYQRDEFRYLWKKMSGDVSLAADVVWSDLTEFHDRKVVLIFRDSLDDDFRQIMTAQHGNGLVHISWRGEKTGQMVDVSHRAARPPAPGTAEKGAQPLHATRIGIEKKGDQFQLWMSWQGEPIHPEGAPVTFKTSGPFYVGIGFTSHLPANVLTGKVANVVLENASARFAKALLPLLLAASAAAAQSPAPPGVPEWALPELPTHKQVAPPLDFHRDAVTLNKPVGIFENQSDIGAALAPGDASYDAASRTYTITSAGYNIWYTRDEFRYLWKKMSGDVSLAATIQWPDADAFGDRKAALVIRQGLNDDAVEALVAQHGAGMVHLARREVQNTRIKDMEYRVGSRGGLPGGRTPDSLVTLHAARIGIEKTGDRFQLWISWEGEAMHPEGAPVTLKIDGPFYVGIGFTSHLPATPLTAKITDVVLENAAGKIR